MDIVISASDVKKLRDMTGAGMMDCKSALKETNGDIEAAIEFLRKKGQKLSVKRADREAKEGVVIAKVNGDSTRGVIVRLSCETDFVAKNDDFVKFADQIADIALNEQPADLDALLNQAFDDTISVGDKVTEQIGVIGEKVAVSNYEQLEGPMIVSYIHMGHRAGVIVELSKADPSFEEAGRNVAMQIAAMNPIAVDKDGVDASVVEKEIEIGKEIALKEGKPEAMLEKIAMGKLGKFYKENTLLNQQYVKDSKMDVRAYLHSIDKDLTVVAFKHVKLG